MNLKDKKTNAERELFTNEFVKKLNNLYIENYENCKLDKLFTNLNFDHQYGSQCMQECTAKYR